MKLHAMLCWWDESPTWLAATVASLHKIGVDHLIAIDGRYPHFHMGAAPNSRLEQVDALTNTAHGAGIAFTLHQPTQPMLESEKRTLAFRVLNAVAEYDDWVTVLDADELFVDGTASVKAELAALPSDTHVAGCRISTAVDPYDTPSADNDLTSATQELHHKHVVPSEFTSLQSRFWRVLEDMQTDVTHYKYQGRDKSGVVWDLRPDIGKKDPSLRPSAVGRFEQRVTIQHRKNHRTGERRFLKREYYDLRDKLGVERQQ